MSELSRMKYEISELPELIANFVLRKQRRGAKDGRKGKREGKRRAAGVD